MMVLLLLLLLLNLNLVSLLVMTTDVETFPHIAKIVTVTEKGRESLLSLSYRIATVRPAQITAVNHSIVMVAENVGTADMVDFLDMVLGVTVKEDMAVRVAIALTAVQPTFAVIRRRRWANREVVGERSSNMVEGEVV